MPSKPHGKKPASECAVCARSQKKYGHPCKRHGGPGHSTSNHGKRPKKDQRSPKPKPAKRPVREPDAGPMKFTANGSISAHIRGLVGAVAHGKAAEAELAAIREAMGE